VKGGLVNMARKRFTRIDEWAGFLTQEMYDKFLADAYANKKKDKDEDKDRDIAYFKAMDLTTLAKTKNDIWVLDEHPDIRINYKKALPRSMRKSMYDTEEEERDAETFTIGRKAFQNKLVLVCQYLSYFTEFYDPEKELFTFYMHMKNIIDSGKESLTVMEFKKHLLGGIFRDSNMKENVYRLVEDNHYIDATVDRKTGRVFNGPDDFTNDDIKRLLAISMVLKIIIPPVEHYIATNTIYPNDDPLISNIMLDLFVDIFYTVGDQHDEYEADIIQEKLYAFTEKKVRKHYKGHSVIWEQQAALRGTTESSQLDRLLVKFLLSDNFFKFQFNNALSAFLKAIIETQLTFTVQRVQYNFDPVRVTAEKGPDGLSGIDKLEQIQLKVDETKAVRSFKALEDVIGRLEKKYGKISDEEIDFYTKYLFNMDKFHNDMINYTFAKEFRGFTELKSCSIRQVMKLVIIAKRQLSDKGYKELQWFMSSLLKGKISNRLLQNSKFINKLKTSSTYTHLISDKYTIMIEGFKDDPILKIISRALNNSYTFVEYEQPELTGEVIVFNEDVISDELLNFIDEI
jgi:hypothetical protein